MAALTLGRTVVAFVAILADLVGCILEAGCFGAVVASTASAIFNSVMVANSTITSALLVFGMLEGNGTRFGFKLYFSRTVGGDDVGGDTDKNDHDQNGNKLFHLLFLLFKVFILEWRMASSHSHLLPKIYRSST